MIVATVVFHVAGLVYLASLLQRIARPANTPQSKIRAMALLVTAVLVIIGIHTAEAWGWAALYLYLGEFSELKRALYFSVVTSTTLGYGDITLSARWQLLGTFEAMGGLILFGTSTAFLLALMRRVLAWGPAEDKHQ
jgi:hypothetical protein